MQETIRNRTIFCRDNLKILRGINSNSIDLIYLDPPFNKKKVFTAPIGSSAEGASFSDIFRAEDVQEEWLQEIKEDEDKVYELLESAKRIEGRTSYNFCYLAYMAIRLIECRRILKDTGSIYYHCDPTMSHYIKLLMDCIFGEENFRREIVWSLKTNSGYKSKVKGWVRGHEIIIYYTKTQRYNFNVLYKKHKPEYIARFKKVSKDGRKYRDDRQGRIQYLDSTHGRLFTDTWEDIMSFQQNSSSKERTGYPTQKPLALLERIIKASSNEGDVVIDPFCGCATTCVASETLKRKWIGIDISVLAYDLVRDRLKKTISQDDSVFDWNKDIHFQTDPPKRTDRNENEKAKKYVYIISHPHYENEYKVGIALNVHSRLNSYQTGDPNRQYKVEYSLLTSHYREIEKYVHEVLPNKHEWVSASFEEIKELIEKFSKEGA